MQIAQACRFCSENRCDAVRVDMCGCSQTGGNPNQAIYGLSDGACGYGQISKDSWPFWQVGALGFGNAISAGNLPQKWGCGACVEVTCQGPVRPYCAPLLCDGLMRSISLSMESRHKEESRPAGLGNVISSCKGCSLLRSAAQLWLPGLHDG